MSEFAVYLDDSGHPADQPYVVVAGFVATETEWLAFEPAWKAVLKKHACGDVFHMVEFQAEKRTDSSEVLEELVGIIRRYTRAQFCCFVDMNGYRRVNNRYALEEFIGTPFSIAARGVAAKIRAWTNRNLSPSDKLLIFFEEGTKHRGDMEEAFKRDLFPLPQTVPKVHYAVQPADMLAWEMFHFARYHDWRRNLRNLIQGREFDEGAFWEDNLIDGCKLASVPLRKDMLQGATVAFHSTPKRKRRRTIK